MDTRKDWAQLVAVKAAEICRAMGIEAEAGETRPGLWSLNDIVYVRDHRGLGYIGGGLVDVCILNPAYAPEDIKTAHPYTTALEWQHSEPLGFREDLDRASFRLLVKATCRAVLEVTLRDAIARLEELRPEIGRAA